jgi:type VI secretion system secreted protein Hcp
MAYEYYISIQGTKQGQVVSRKFLKWIPVLSFNMAVTSPRDAATGQASGKRQHKPIVVGLPWDNASPKLFSAMVNNEVLDPVVINIQPGGSTGSGKQNYQWIKLHNALISDISTHTVNHTQVQDVTLTYEDVQMGTGHHTTSTDSWELEQVALTFQKITVSNSLGKAAFADNWKV